MADNWLKDVGFNVVELPRRDIGPSDVLLRQNGAFDQKVGTLRDLFASDANPPAETSDESAATVARRIDRKVEAKLGLRILGALFGAGTAGKLGAETSMSRARSLAVTYEDVRHDSVGVLPLQSWIEGARVQTSRQAQVWLNNRQLAAVTAVLRTARLAIVAEQASGVALELSVPEIQGIVGGEATVSRASADSSRITFTGREPIAFGFQAFVMNFDGNVSAGLDVVRTKALGGPPARGWTGDEAVAEIEDAALPSNG
jgi:hypothetical protein